MPPSILDAHQATISVAVRDSRGNLVMEAIIETKAETILQFIRGLRGVCMFYDLLQPHVARVLASDPRKNALLKAGNKSDRIDVPRRTGYSHFGGTGTQLGVTRSASR